jgi:hypothetical protein
VERVSVVMRRCLVVLAAALVFAPAARAATATPLVPVSSAEAPMAAYGGYVVLSEKGDDGLWRLTVVHDGVKTALAQVAPRAVPFDVDAGPDGAERPTAVFSRCADDATRRGCTLRAVSLPGGGERALKVPRPAGASDRTPAVWGPRVAFSRRAQGAIADQVMVYDFAHRRMRTLRHGALPHTCPFAGGCAKAHYEGHVGELDLSARTVAFSWQLTAPGVFGAGPGWELRAVRTGGGRQTLLAGNGYVSGACGARTPFSPNATADGVAFLSRWYHCETVTGTLTRTTFAARGRLDRTDDVGGAVAWRIALDAADGTSYALLGPARLDTQTGLPVGSGLTLARVGGIAFDRTTKRATEPFMTGS